MWSVACCSALLLLRAESQSPAGHVAVTPWHIGGTREVGVRLRRLSWARTCDGDACNGSVKQCGDLMRRRRPRLIEACLAGVDVREAPLYANNETSTISGWE
jgi:hypothetical protein